MQSIFSSASNYSVPREKNKNRSIFDSGEKIKGLDTSSDDSDENNVNIEGTNRGGVSVNTTNSTLLPQRRWRAKIPSAAEIIRKNEGIYDGNGRRGSEEGNYNNVGSSSVDQMLPKDGKESKSFTPNVERRNREDNDAKDCVDWGPISPTKALEQLLRGNTTGNVTDRTNIKTTPFHSRRSSSVNSNAGSKQSRRTPQKRGQSVANTERINRDSQGTNVPQESDSNRQNTPESQGSGVKRPPMKLDIVKSTTTSPGGANYPPALSKPHKLSPKRGSAGKDQDPKRPCSAPPRGSTNESVVSLSTLNNSNSESIDGRKCCRDRCCIHSRQSIVEFIAMQSELRRCYAKIKDYEESRNGTAELASFSGKSIDDDVLREIQEAYEENRKLDADKHQEELTQLENFYREEQEYLLKELAACKEQIRELLQERENNREEYDSLTAADGVPKLGTSPLPLGSQPFSAEHRIQDTAVCDKKDRNHGSVSPDNVRVLQSTLSSLQSLLKTTQIEREEYRKEVEHLSQLLTNVQIKYQDALEKIEELQYSGDPKYNTNTISSDAADVVNAVDFPQAPFIVSNDGHCGNGKKEEKLKGRSYPFHENVNRDAYYYYTGLPLPDEDGMSPSVEGETEKNSGTEGVDPSSESTPGPRAPSVYILNHSRGHEVAPPLYNSLTRTSNSTNSDLSHNVTPVSSSKKTNRFEIPVDNSSDGNIDKRVYHNRSKEEDNPGDSREYNHSSNGNGRDDPVASFHRSAADDSLAVYSCSPPNNRVPRFHYRKGDDTPHDDGKTNSITGVDNTPSPLKIAKLSFVNESSYHTQEGTVQSKTAADDTIISIQRTPQEERRLSQNSFTPYSNNKGHHYVNEKDNIQRKLERIFSLSIEDQTLVPRENTAEAENDGNLYDFNNDPIRTSYLATPTPCGDGYHDRREGKLAMVVSNDTNSLLQLLKTSESKCKELLRALLDKERQFAELAAGGKS